MRWTIGTPLSSGRGWTARAALFGAGLLLGADSVQNLQKGRLRDITFQAILGEVSIGVLNGKGSAMGIARATRTVSRGTTELGLFSAARLLAGKLTLGFGAKSRGLALPGALGFLAKGGAVRFGSGAGSAAHCRAADCFARGATLQFAHLFGAAYRAHWFFAVYFALGALRLFAVHLAFRTSADGVAFCGADGIVTKPLALRVALSLDSNLRGSSESNNAGNDGEFHHLK